MFYASPPCPLIWYCMCNALCKEENWHSKGALTWFSREKKTKLPCSHSAVCCTNLLKGLFCNKISNFGTKVMQFSNCSSAFAYSFYEHYYEVSKFSCQPKVLVCCMLYLCQQTITENWNKIDLSKCKAKQTLKTLLR